MLLFLQWITTVGGAEPKAEPTTDFSLTPAMGVMEGERQIMTESQYKCLELLSRDGIRNKTGRIRHILSLTLTAYVWQLWKTLHIVKYLILTTIYRVPFSEGCILKNIFVKFKKALQIFIGKGLNNGFMLVQK